MDCSTYRSNYAEFAKLPLPRKVWDTPEWTAWSEHAQSCVQCSDWDLVQRVIERGHDPNAFPCVHIAEQVTQSCDEHPDPQDCADILVTYYSPFDEYSIPIRDGGSSSSSIKYCPWCGKQLPESKRDRWFRELEELGYDNPLLSDDIPDRYLTDDWYKDATEQR